MLTNTIKLAWAALAVTMLAGCQTPLASYVIGQGYEPFEVPRDSDGVGTVITFESGREVTIARPEECLSEVSIRAEGTPRRVALESYDYRITSDDHLELALLEVLQPDLRLEAAASFDRVRSIHIRLVEPFEIVASVKSLAEALPDLEGICRPLVLDDSHYVISQVLGARGLEYEFLDAGGNMLTIDAALLDRINAGAGLRSRFEGLRSLSVDFPIYIGYRILRADHLPGVGEDYVCTPVPPGEVRALKNL